MKFVTTAAAAALASFASLAPLPAAAAEAAVDAAAEVRVTRAGSQASVKGPAENFSGTVRVDAPFKGTGAARAGGATVTFEPGARSAWHRHPLGQTLIVTAGAGLVQHWGGPLQEIKSGDTVWLPPNVKHWHGAAPPPP